MKKKILSRLLSLCMALTMVLCIAPAVSAADFSDVSANAWYHEAVDYVSGNDLMGGTGNGQFSPNATMSRAMLVTVLHRMDGSPAASGNGGLSDVPANAYYTSAVAWAAGNQIISGTGNGNFSPNALISRQQLAAILYRYAAHKNYDTSASVDISRYTDAAAVSGYAQDAMRWAVGAGIISGSDGRLMPSGSATRAQAAAMLMRFAQDTDQPNVEPQPSESRVLIAYFSRADFVSPGTDAVSGATASAANTKTVAEHIQRTVGGDLFEIVPEKDYPESHSEASVIAGQELEDNARPELMAHVQNMDDYDAIILGYPAWHHTAPMAVRTFLEEYDFTGKTIIPYMTSLGNSVDQSVSDIRTLCPTATVLDGIALTHGSSSRWNEQAAQWLNGILSTDSPVNPPANQERTAITLTIGNQRLDAWLNGSAASKDLISRLPVTVTLADSDNDYCGGISPALTYEQSEVQSGYRNGDLAFWTAGNDFVIFVDDEESSANTGNLVILGQVTDDYSALIGRGGTVDVTIALKGQEVPVEPDEPTEQPMPSNPTGERRMKITVGNQEIYATLADNATAHAIADRLPLTLELLDLYGREMCYRFADEMPANEVQTRNFELGEIIYWPPRHSFVIMYKQDGEQFSMQHVGQLENVSDVDLFGHGNVTVTFELI